VSESPVPIGEPPELVRAGRDALARRAWSDAFDLLSRADAERPLPGADLEALADAAFFAGRGDARIEVKERAYQAYLGEDDRVRAAYLALDVAMEHMLRGHASIASAWARRAEPLLQGIDEGYAHGFLLLIRSEMAKARGDLAAAEALAMEAVEIGRRAAHPDLRATALTTLGTLKVATGAATDGIALLEEAAVSAVSGELSPITAGVTSCQMIAVCRDLTDYQRATEWLEATDRWCRRQEVSGFPGVCRVHRAEIVAMQGGWDIAEEELRKATTELKAYSAFPPMADGLYAIGEIRRLKGDVAGAEEVLREAHALGRSPQPALALARLGAGEVNAAMAAIGAALREATADQWARARLLAAQVEIAIAAGDVARARAAADELAAIVEGYNSVALGAGKHEANGRVLLAEGDPGAAIPVLRNAARLWREVGAAYEIARVRFLLARALRMTGSDDDAGLELRAARDEFARLGAGPDLAAAEAELRTAAERRTGAEQVRRTFVFTDIVGSTKLAEALGNEAWERLLRWHDDMLRSLFSRHAGVVVSQTGDGFFVAFDSTPPAVACAIEVQRSLADHRATVGFAPPVRIGIHAARATVRGNDYSGVGVHVAARLADLADGGEILISQEALAEAGRVLQTSEPRDVAIRGFSAPITIAEIAWR